MSLGTSTVGRSSDFREFFSPASVFNPGRSSSPGESSSPGIPSSLGRSSSPSGSSSPDESPPAVGTPCAQSWLWGWAGTRSSSNGSSHTAGPGAGAGVPRVSRGLGRAGAMRLTVGCPGTRCVRAVRASETGGGWGTSKPGGEQADSQKALLEMEPKSCGSNWPCAPSPIARWEWGGVRAGMCPASRLSGSWAQPGTQGTTWHYTGSPWHRPTASQPASANPGLLPSPRQLGPPHPLAERGSCPYIHPWLGLGAGKRVGKAPGEVWGWESGWMGRWDANFNMNGQLHIFMSL